uniref:PiggyBac transposable element-derived protein domain-containing protein n=1 Tax=Eptatretus burgeri TaxID=7764 RepID=A0A8C4NJI7_EPTBU
MLTIPWMTRRTNKSSGPCHSLPGSATVLDFFHLLWPEQLFEMMVLETNRSAEQRAVVLGKMDPLWSPVNVPELKAFFSIVVMMGIKSLPRIWCYWSGNRALRCEWVSSIMSYTRFAKIRQYLQASNGSCVTERSDPTYDPIYKVRAIVDKLQTNFSQYYRPRRELSVDEGMIPFKGRLFFKQHMPNKPAKWGIKVWELCEAQTGYCLSFDIYTGRRRDGGTEHGLGYKVVMHLSKPYWHKGHHLYFDRYFSSPHLLEDLENRCGTYGCSTVSLHRTGLPLAARTSSLQARGDVEFFQKRNLVLTLWRDRRLVSMLSTNIDPRVDIGGNGTTRPLSVLQYNQFMGGVDRSDQYRSYYSVGRTSKKWWCYILWFLVNLSIVNAWLLFRESCHDYTSSKNYDHFQFRVDLAEQLRAGWAKRAPAHMAI